MDRFAATAAVLGGFASGRLSPSDPGGWLEPLERAGVHPVSLLLCSTARDLARLEPLRPILAELGPQVELVPAISYDTIVAWSPLAYAHEIDHWTLRTAGPLDLGSDGPGRGLPDHLLSLGGVTVQDDAQVRTLGRGWAVVGNLKLVRLSRLQVLRGTLEVYGDLELDGLPELRELGPGIRIHGNLTVAGCPALRGFPKDLAVAGAVWMDAVPGRFKGGGLARRIAAPWPGIQPRPVPIANIPAGAQELAGGAITA